MALKRLGSAGGGGEQECHSTEGCRLRCDPSSSIALREHPPQDLNRAAGASLDALVIDVGRGGRARQRDLASDLLGEAPRRLILAGKLDRSQDDPRGAVGILDDEGRRGGHQNGQTFRIARLVLRRGPRGLRRSHRPRGGARRGGIERGRFHRAGGNREGL